MLDRPVLPTLVWLHDPKPTSSCEDLSNNNEFEFAMNESWLDEFCDVGRVYSIII
jgi:hypothetical protein